MKLTALDRLILLAVLAMLAWAVARNPVTVNFVSFDFKQRQVPVIQVPGEAQQMTKQL